MGAAAHAAVPASSDAAACMQARGARQAGREGREGGPPDAGALCCGGPCRPGEDAPSEEDEGPVPDGLDDKVVQVYRGVGKLLSRYTAGKVRTCRHTQLLLRQHAASMHGRHLKPGQRD